MSRYVPTYHAKSIFDINIEFYKKLGVKFILTDLDNTLDSYRTAIPSEKVLELKKMFDDNNIELVIISNNHGKRVRTYADALRVRYYSSVRKPFAFKLLKFLKQDNINPNDCIMIGDQTVTDIACANACSIKCVLTDKIVKEDQPTTYFNRLFDRPIRKRLAKKNLLKEWSI